jgi:hypothetical protein
MNILKNILVASIALMPVLSLQNQALAHDISEDTVKVAYALGNTSEDALKVAEGLAKANGIQGTYAGFYLNNLVNDTELLLVHAHELALLVDADRHDDNAVARKLEQVSLYYNRTSDGSEKVASYLYPLNKTSEAYRLKAAYTKIRTRFVYLQNAL